MKTLELVPQKNILIFQKPIHDFHKQNHSIRIIQIFEWIFNFLESIRDLQMLQVWNILEFCMKFVGRLSLFTKGKNKQKANRSFAL